MIAVRGSTKRYGDRLAVDDLSFTVQPGRVAGFLGPNGAGKSTTMRLIPGLDAPTRGSATVDGRPYRHHAVPLHEVGALLEARSVHPGRSACHHLLAIAQTGGVGRSRVDEVVDLVGLRGVARRRAGRVTPAGDGALTVSGLSTDQVGRIAGAAGITLLELGRAAGLPGGRVHDRNRGRGGVPRAYDQRSRPMTTLTQPPAQPPPAHDARKRVTQAKVVRSEWTKFRSQPSAAWSLLVVGFPPATLADKVASYLPTPAGVAVTDVRPDPASLGPWTGFGLACLCTAIVPGLAAWRLRRRDV